MARIRTIKPELPHSETLGRVSREARLLFINLFTIADDEGRARAASRLLASLLYPFDDDAPRLIDGWMGELAGVGAIRRYEVGGVALLDIPKWLEHQKIDRPTPSRLPEYSRALASPREASPPDLGPRTLDLGVQSPSETGADAPLKERIFGPALEWLAKATGRPPDAIRRLLGRWCSRYGDGRCLEALQAAARNAPLDPVPYIEKVIRDAARKPATADGTYRSLLGALHESVGGVDAGPVAAGGPRSEEAAADVD